MSVWWDTVVKRGNRCCLYPKGAYERLRYRSLVKDKCKSLIMRFESPGEKKKEIIYIWHNVLFAVGNWKLNSVLWEAADQLA